MELFTMDVVKAYNKLASVPEALWNCFLWMLFFLIFHNEAR